MHHILLNSRSYDLTIYHCFSHRPLIGFIKRCAIKILFFFIFFLKIKHYFEKGLIFAVVIEGLEKRQQIKNFKLSRFYLSI